MVVTFEYNALRDDDPRQRWIRFWYFTLDVAMLTLGVYFLYRYATAWEGHSNLFWKWLLPGLVALLIAFWVLTAVWHRKKSEYRREERFVTLKDGVLEWWLDRNESAHRINLDEIDSISYHIREVKIYLKNGKTYRLPTYLIMAEEKERRFREILQDRLPTASVS